MAGKCIATIKTSVVLICSALTRWCKKHALRQTCELDIFWVILCSHPTRAEITLTNNFKTFPEIVNSNSQNTCLPLSMIQFSETPLDSCSAICSNLAGFVPDTFIVPVVFSQEECWFKIPRRTTSNESSFLRLCNLHKFIQTRKKSSF